MDRRQHILLKSVDINKTWRNKALYIYVIFFLIMIMVFLNKKNLFVDEWLSYTLANGEEGVTVAFEDRHTYTSIEPLWYENMTVNNFKGGGEFDFKIVWRNQTNDVHPPFYYLILHIICSYNAGKFSIWYAAGINVFFAILTLYVWRKLMHLLINNRRIIDFCSTIFILSEGILQNVSLLRMYVMAMFWVTLTAYLFVRAFEEKFSWMLWTLIGLTAICGALTHYYCIIYLCGTCLIFGLCMLIQQRWKDILVLAGYMTASAVISVGIFPAMLTHMFSGYRGTQSMDNLTKATWDEHWERLKTFYGFINKQMLGKIGGGCVAFGIFLIIMFVVLKNNKGSMKFYFCKIQIMKTMIVVVPAIIYFIFVSESAAYVTDRYLFPIYAVAFGCFVYMIVVFSRKIFSEQNAYIAMCFIGTVVVINGLGNIKWDFLFKESADLLNKASMYSDQNCICVYDEKWKVQPDFYELKNYKSVTFFQQEQTDGIIQYKDLFDDSFILTVVGGNDDKIIHMIQECYPYLNQYEKVGAYSYSITYRIYAEEKNE